jgi:hypothetical protein
VQRSQHRRAASLQHVDAEAIGSCCAPAVRRLQRDSRLLQRDGAVHAVGRLRRRIDRPRRLVAHRPSHVEEVVDIERVVIVARGACTPVVVDPHAVGLLGRAGDATVGSLHAGRRRLPLAFAACLAHALVEGAHVPLRLLDARKLVALVSSLLRPHQLGHVSLLLS